MIWIAGGLLKATMFSLVTNLEGHAGTPMPNTDQNWCWQRSLEKLLQEFGEINEKVECSFLFRSLPFRMLTTVKNSLNNGFFSTPKYLFDEYQIPLANYVFRIWPQKWFRWKHCLDCLVILGSSVPGAAEQARYTGIGASSRSQPCGSVWCCWWFRNSSNHLACHNPSINSILCLFNLTCYFLPWKIIIKPPFGEYVLISSNHLKQNKTISVTDS